jgi:hypothetical protein
LHASNTYAQCVVVTPTLVTPTQAHVHNTERNHAQSHASNSKQRQRVTAQHQHGAVEHAQGTLDLDGEVNVTYEVFKMILS